MMRRPAVQRLEPFRRWRHESVADLFQSGLKSGGQPPVRLRRLMESGLEPRARCSSPAREASTGRCLSRLRSGLIPPFEPGEIVGDGNIG